MVDAVQQEFMAAMAARDLPKITSLLVDGLCANFVMGTSGETPLIRAIATNDYELAELLIANGADPNFRGTDPASWTPLMFAHNNFNFLKLLLGAGADVNATAAVRPALNGDRIGGETALHLAAAVNNEEAVKLLIQSGAHVEALDCNGKGPLDYAIRIGNTNATAVALVDAGAELTTHRIELMNSAGVGTEYELINAQLLLMGLPLPDPSTPPIVLDWDGRKTLKCPFCGALLYSRVPKLCGSCGKLLPPDLVQSAPKVAASTNSNHAASAPDASHAHLPLDAAGQPSIDALLRRVSCAAEFKARPRPLFLLYVALYAIIFSLPLWFMWHLHVLSFRQIIYANLIAVCLFLWRCLIAWNTASPICPNCRQNITSCFAKFCHVCAKPLQNGCCFDCDVDNSPLRFFKIYGRAGNSKWVTYCPSCAVLLDTKVSRSRRLLRRGF